MNSNYACATEQGYANHVRRNDAPCPTCKLWKQKHDAGEAAKPAPIRSKRQVAECGTLSGYRKHRRHGEAACAPCREAANEASRIQKAKTRSKRVAGTPRAAASSKPRTQHRREISHGSVAGYQAHKRRDEQPCEPCLEALREKSKKDRANAPKKPRVRTLLPCGTAAAYLRHLRDNEEACPPCREAQRLDSIAKRARKIEREGGPRPHAGRKPINHGTTAGRAQHMRRGETPCPPCRDAFNAYNRAYSASARKKAKAQQ